MGPLFVANKVGAARALTQQEALVFQQDPMTMVGTLTCQQLKEMFDRGDTLRLVDVRTPMERELCTLEPSTLLDTQETADAVLAADDGAPVVFFCHHGGRSYSAAMWFAQRGLAKPLNLLGGIDAWSREIDPTVPRY